MTANGKDIRNGIADEIFPLITLVDSADRLPYLPGTFNSHSPLICLAKEEDESPSLTNSGDQVSFYVPVWIMALYTDQNGVSYDAQDAHNLMSDIKSQLREAIITKRKVSGKWQKVTQDGRSQVLQPFPVAGDVYILEIVILKVEVY